MATKRTKALLATGRTDWANGRTGSKDRRLFLYDTFLIGCPIPGVSSSGSELPALLYHDNSLAGSALKECLSGIDNKNIFVSIELRQVAKRLIESGRAEESVPKTGEEFAIYAKSPVGVLKDSYGLFSGREKKSLLIDDARPYNSVLELDALFRHLRNSLAHGLFCEVRRKSLETGRSEPFLYIQDNNSKHQISARMFLSYSRLQRMGNFISGESNV